MLDLVLREQEQAARRQLLHTALAGGQGDVPGVMLEALATTSRQYIDDMEEQEVGATP